MNHFLPTLNPITVKHFSDQVVYSFYFTGEAVESTRQYLDFQSPVPNVKKLRSHHSVLTTSTNHEQLKIRRALLRSLREVRSQCKLLPPPNWHEHRESQFTRAETQKLTPWWEPVLK